MKKLLVNKDKEKEIEDVLNLISNSNNGYISVNLKRGSDYLYRNIDELNNLLLDKSKGDYYENEYIKLGLDIAKYILNDKENIKVKYSNRLIEIVSSYIFMVMPETNEFVLMPTYVFPITYESYDDLINIIPDIVNILIDNGYAYVEGKEVNK